MESPKISIIIAVYNTESYLYKCIESIVNQTYQNLEIILVDDGSTDNSLLICTDFSKKDNRIKIFQKSNGGQGSARNLALEQASGEWIGFVDSDDWIEVDMYEYLFSKALSEECEIVECGWNKVSHIGDIEFTTPSMEIVLSREQAMHSLVYAKGEGVNTSVCNKIFKRELISDIRFPEVRAYEDDEFIHKVVWNSKRILKVGDAKYNYLTRKNSTMTSQFNFDKLALIIVQKNICNFLRNNAPQYFTMSQKVLISKLFFSYYMVSSCYNEKSEVILKNIREEIIINFEEFCNNKLLGVNKIMLYIFKYFPDRFTKLVLYIYFRK